MRLSCFSFSETTTNRINSIYELNIVDVSTWVLAPSDNAEAHGYILDSNHHKKSVTLTHFPAMLNTVNVKAKV